MRRVLVAGALAVLLAGACGVPADGSAEVTDPEDVPFGLLDEEREPVTGPEPGRGSVVDLYLYDDGDERLVPVPNQIERASLQNVLSTLVETAASDVADARGLRSALADTEVTIEVETTGGVAAIDLSEEFTDLSGADQLIAIAQLVFTSTGRPGVGQVTFTLEGAPIEIPRGDGSLTSGTVTRDDYADLAPA